MSEPVIQLGSGDNMAEQSADVIVVGAGNAAFCAALAAQELGASVLMLEAAPEEESGGNSRFTAGAMRVVYSGVDDIKQLVPDLSENEIATTDFGTYTEDQFFDDMARITQYRADPNLVELLVTRSLETLLWVREKGVRFVPIYGKQAFKVDGKFKFWGGLTIEAVGGGPGLVDMLTQSAKKRGIQISYNTRAVDLISDGVRVQGVRVRQNGAMRDIYGKTVVLASGGFEANNEWRTRYLGPGWDLAKVRGTRFNTGDGIRMALDIGASPAGNWSGCHAVGWDMNAPEFGDLAVGDQFQKHSYPFSIMVNATGKRFLDEGADFRNYTYAKYGRVILEQPGQFAWQIWDQKTKHLQRDEYRIRQITKVTANTLEELATKLDGVNPEQFLKTVTEYNTAVQTNVPFNPNVKDGRGTRDLAINKTNWANTIDQPPFEGYAVTCGITFTFGGLRITTSGEVLNLDHQPIPGLYAAGELVGGLFYFNYPGGSGLTSGSVFGKIAGTSAATAVAR
jgi:tricarballylate dehydrogenase